VKEENPKFSRFLKLTGLPADKAAAIYNAYTKAGGDDVDSLAELVDKVKSCDPALGTYLANWGPTVLDDRGTMEAIFTAYAYARERGIKSIEKLPSQKRWTLQQLMPEAQHWIEGAASGLSTTVSSTIYVGPSSSLGLSRPLSLADSLHDLPPKAVDALRALEELGPIYEADVARALIRLRLGFDYAWDETLSSLDPVDVEGNFSRKLKELFLDPTKKYMGKDFYDWVIELCYSGHITYNSERNLLYVLTAFRQRFL